MKTRVRMKRKEGRIEKREEGREMGAKRDRRRKKYIKLVNILL
jgi:hypothetical protein